jgi:cell wall-associated NlpC family hydrolase
VSDRRLTPANGRVAATRLRGIVKAERYLDGDPASVIVPVADLLASPGGARDRQLLLGARVRIYERQAGWAFVEALADEYCGYLPEAQLGPPCAATHAVTARATHVYPAPDMKTTETMALSLGAAVQVLGSDGHFARTPQGYIPARHLRALAMPESDPVAVVKRLVGTPYLWGGNSAFGIDCSGLVQIALFACGQPCPGDSDLQEHALGETLPPGTPPQRGDLLFWKGHVAWVAGPDTLLHANAHHMAVACEPLAAAIRRIEAAGDGPVTRHARLSLTRRGAIG